jgi:hypothetical protein
LRNGNLPADWSARSRSGQAFYAAHGFIRLPESLRLVLPMQTVEKLLATGPRGAQGRQ